MALSSADAAFIFQHFTFLLKMFSSVLVFSERALVNDQDYHHPMSQAISPSGEQQPRGKPWTRPTKHPHHPHPHLRLAQAFKVQEGGSIWKSAQGEGQCPQSAEDKFSEHVGSHNPCRLVGKGGGGVHAPKSRLVFFRLFCGGGNRGCSGDTSEQIEKSTQPQPWSL